MTETCQSCGIEMIAEDDHAGGDIAVPYCTVCADHEGELKSRRAVENALIERVLEEHDTDRHQARQAVRRQMDEMPAWSR